MKQNEHKKIESEVQKLYKKIVDEANQGNIIVPNDLKDTFLQLEKLTKSEQVELIKKLSKSESLPKIMREFVNLIEFQQAFDEVPDEIHKEIGSFLKASSELAPLSRVNKYMNTLFKNDIKFSRFPQLVSYGKQDEIEKLFGQLKKQDIQEFLCTPGTATDYSDRTFNCTPYEYAYWAKDTLMCRMLELNMDEDTKAQMLKRCKAIEKDGLEYIQNGKKCRTKHVDLTPLTTAMKDFVDNYDHWKNNEMWDAMEAAWMKVGLAQRNVPAHVIHEYCRSDRSFDPLPSFNEGKLTRRSLVYNSKTNKQESVFPLVITGTSGLGLDFALIRSPTPEWGAVATCTPPFGEDLLIDLLAVSRLDEIRTVDLKQSLDNLKPKEPEYKLGL